MKYLKALLCLFAVSLLFSGCGMTISSSIDDLISPLAPFGENADIKSALDAFAQNGYSLKSPSAGDYVTSYNFYDLNGDGVDEAIAFYEPSDNLGSIDLAVIEKIDGRWTVVENIQGAGTEVSSLHFDDLNGDGTVEIFVCWDAIANSSNHELCVYHFEESEDGKALVPLESAITVNNYITADFFNDGEKELLLLEISTGNTQSNKAELYSLEDDGLVLLGDTKLDSHVSSYVRLSVETAEDVMRIYADGMGTDGSSMLTEIIYWSDTYHTIISPFYSYLTGVSEETKRSLPVPSIDVNDDGLIEIPIDYRMADEEDGISIFDCRIFKHSVLLHSDYVLYCARDGYVLRLPEPLVNLIVCDYDDTTHELTLIDSDTKQPICSLMPVLKATYSADKYPNYSVIHEENGYCFLALQGSDGELALSPSDLENMIKVIE
ncbi:MAG: VCBS repeat-containing protein [Eubacterium sp.]|nr:VCBS repeat-containing protein [Eubacterium sp.]